MTVRIASREAHRANQTRFIAGIIVRLFGNLSRMARQLLGQEGGSSRPIKAETGAR